jgi:serine/threonine protein kinase
VETVRGIVGQIANGLLAFHRLEMLHQDLRPQNVMIDGTGTAKLIDFGSTRVAGISEIDSAIERSELLGTLQYTAPEYFLGESGTARSDLFSLGVIAYQMLSGRLPYGAEVPKARTRAAQRQLKYQTVLDDEREIPAWIDEVLRKATHPDPNRRYEELSEFVHDLRHPTQGYLQRKRAPLLERNPVAFWRSLSLILAGAVVILLLR